MTRALPPVPPRFEMGDDAAVAAWRTLTDALAETDPACRDDPRFTDDDASVADLPHMGVLCGSCPIRPACEAYALAMPRALASGFWAGESRGSKLRTTGPRKRASDAA
jgi:hypothetical protein